MTSVLPSPTSRVARQRTGGEIAEDDGLLPDLIDVAPDAVAPDDLDLDFSLLPEAPVSPAPARAGHQGPAELTERQREMLAFERIWWRRAGSKEQAIREQFQLSATRYYQLLNRLLGMPEALAFDPITVARLRRLRESRSRARSTA